MKDVMYLFYMICELVLLIVYIINIVDGNIEMGTLSMVGAIYIHMIRVELE